MTRPLTWRSCPLLAAAGCFAIGIVTADGAGRSVTWAWLLGCLPAVACAASVALRIVASQVRPLVSLRPILRAGAAALALTACGAACFSLLRTPVPSPLTRLAAAEQDVRVIGRVADVPELHSWGHRFTLRLQMVSPTIDAGSSDDNEIVHQMNRSASAGTQTAKPHAAAAIRGNICVYLYEAPAHLRLQEGDLVRLGGTLEPLPVPRNPGSFDYGRYLRRHGISAILKVDAKPHVTIIAHSSSPLQRTIVGMRGHVRRVLGRYVRNGEARSVLQALLLGQRHRIEDATIDHFTRTGLLHLLAVSGLHVMLVGLVIYRLLQPVLLRLGLTWRTATRLRVGVTLTLLLSYMLMTGSNASVVRAVLMAALYLGGALLQRRTQSLNILGAAAFLILAVEPNQLFDVGFQLSFSAVGGLILLTGIIGGRTSGGSNSGGRLPVVWQLLAPVVASLAAVLGTLPVLLFHFGRVAPIGLVLNVVAIPLAMLALASGLLLILCGGWWHTGASIVAEAANIWIQLLLRLAGESSHLFGWSVIEYTLTSGWALAALSAFILALAFLHAPRRRWRLLCIGACLSALAVWHPILTAADRHPLRVLFFDVGQGDAALVALPNGRHLLIDAGPGGRYARTFERVLLPYFRHRHISRLDGVLITHPHSDHLGGALQLVREMPVDHVYTNGKTYSSSSYQRFRHLLDSLKLHSTPLRAGDRLTLDPSVAIHVLSPAGSSGTANDASIVVRMVYGQTSWLFLGDAEAAAERALLSHYGPLLDSDVIKVGHHGSRTSSWPSLVDEATRDPEKEWAIISVGRRNVFGLPDEEVLSRWQGAGAKVALTSDGAVELVSDGRTIQRAFF